MTVRVLVRVALAGLVVAGAANICAAQSDSSPPALRKLTLDDAIPDKHGVKRLAVLRGLNKITGRAIDIEAPAGVAVRYGSLLITVRYCYTRPPEEPPETTAFLQIDDVQPGQEPARVFSGWMFASTPALHALEHAVYDVWVITCRTNAPGPTPPAPAPGKIILKPPPAAVPPAEEPEPNP
jgi:hypothetical protein